MYIIGGEFKRRKIHTPTGEQTRPSKNMLRETLFNICAQIIQEVVFVDLFAGSGAIGFEALSRGAQHVYFIEQHKNAIVAIEKNIELLKVQDRATLLKGNVFDLIPKIPALCDIVFADPPYAIEGQKSYALRLLEYFEKKPLLKENGWLYLEVGIEEKIDFDRFNSVEFIKTRLFGGSQLIELRQK